MAQIITIDVTAINDTPFAADNTITIDEDNSYTFSAMDFGFSDIDRGDTLDHITIQSTPAAGTLQLNGSTVSIGQQIAAADLSHLVFTPDANEHGADYANFIFTVSDGELDSKEKTITVNVTAINDAPSAADNTITIDEDSSHIFSAMDFGFSDVDASDALDHITIQSIPTAGTLKLNGSTVSTDQQIAVADLSHLVFTPAANQNGAAYANFTFTVSDGELDSDERTITINVTAVNDTPSSIGNTITIDEDGNHTFSATDFRFSDIDTDDTLDHITIKSIPSAGTLKLNGSTVSTEQQIAAADLSHLLFIPDANQNGAPYANFTFTVSDGKADSVAHTIMIDVIAIKDAPVAVNNTIAINEDGSHTFSATDFGFSDADRGDSLEHITIQSTPAVGTLKLNGFAVSTNQQIAAADLSHLVFTPDANQNGVAYASFKFTVSDGELDSDERTVVFHVTPVNDAPMITTDSLSGAIEGTLYTAVITTSDLDAGDVVVLSSTDLPEWLSLTDNTLSGIPSNDYIGDNVFTITATDKDGVTDTKTYVIHVINVPPEFADNISTEFPKVNQNENFAFDLTPLVKEYSANGVHFSLSNHPGWMAIEGNVLKGTPESSTVVNYTFTITVDDGHSSVSKIFSLETVFVSPLVIEDSSESMDSLIDEFAQDASENSFEVGSAAINGDIFSGDSILSEVSSIESISSLDQISDIQNAPDQDALEIDANTGLIDTNNPIYSNQTVASIIQELSGVGIEDKLNIEDIKNIIEGADSSYINNSQGSESNKSETISKEESREQSKKSI